MHSCPLKLLSVIALAVLLFGCSTEHYRQSADKEVYEVIAEKSPQVPNMDPKFSLEDQTDPTLEAYPINEEAVEFFGAAKDAEVGCRIITLNDALALAVHHNRQYQNEKESLYLEALSLTLSRYQYTPIFSASSGIGYQEKRRDASSAEIAAGIDELTTERQLHMSGQTSGDMLLRAGGKIAVGLTTDFFRYLIGDRSLATSSSLVGTISQPLLRGGGIKAALENLAQAERNLLYSLRNFTRFRREFTVDIVTEYYRVLQNRDRARNAWQAYQNFKSNVKFESVRYEEGLTRKADLAELQESELTNEQSWINAVRNYYESLDRFKILLGLTTHTRVVLDDGELEKLQIDETHLNMTLTQAIEVALASRLDLATVNDQVADGERRIDVAANGLLPDVDLVVTGRVNNATDKTRPNLDFKRYTWNAGLNIDLPLDRKRERNTYYAALIGFERARRQHENFVDQIRLDIQNSWRNLEQAKRDYEISQVRGGLSRSRVREQELLSEIGEGGGFELVRAQDALTASQNQLTSALINHTIIRLGFWRDLGLLYITQDGKWKETTHAKSNKND